MLICFQMGSSLFQKIQDNVAAKEYMESISIKLFLWAETQYRAEQHKK